MEITFLPFSTETTHSPLTNCLACKSIKTFPAVRVDGPGHLEAKSTSYTYFRCLDCGTLTSSPPPPLNAETYGGTSPAQWQHYVDIGAGIDSMLKSLAGAVPKGVLVDVGCGFGFASDYWRRMGSPGARAVAIDEAVMASKGSQILDFKLYPPGIELSDEDRGDWVFASEVIEHVVDPLTFLLEVKRNVAKEDAMFIFTTPAAEYVTAESPLSILRAVLSPGFHTCVLSEAGIRIIFRKAGIPNIHVSRAQERFTISSAGIHLRPTARVEGPEKYWNYLRALSTSQHPRLRLGVQYRLFKELVNCGETVEADHVAVELISGLRQQFQVSLSSSRDNVHSFIQSLNLGFETHLHAYPAWYSPFLFYYGQHLRNLGLPGQQAAFMESALSCLKAEASAWPEFAQEADSLIDPCHVRLFECGVFLSVRFARSTYRWTGKSPKQMIHKAVRGWRRLRS